MSTKHRPGRKKRPSKKNYDATGRKMQNKVRSIERQIKEQPNNEHAKSDLARVKATCK